MKRGVVGISLALLLVLSLSPVSAGWFSDAWGRITGNAVADTYPGVFISLEGVNINNLIGDNVAIKQNASCRNSVDTDTGGGVVPSGFKEETVFIPGVSRIVQFKGARAPYATIIPSKVVFAPDRCLGSYQIIKLGNGQEVKIYEKIEESYLDPDKQEKTNGAFGGLYSYTPQKIVYSSEKLGAGFCIEQEIILKNDCLAQAESWVEAAIKRRDLLQSQGSYSGRSKSENQWDLKLSNNMKHFCGATTNSKTCPNTDTIKSARWVSLGDVEQNELEATCVDSDGGLEPYIFGHTDFKMGSFESQHEDACALILSYDPDGSPGGWQDVESCSGKNCYVEEAFCRTDENRNFIDADADQLIKCENGCSDGACVPNEDGAEFTCTDSDGGKDYYVKGMVISRAGDEQILDSCKDDSTLLEGTCDEQGGKIYEYNCPNGCSDGACIPPASGGVGGGGPAMSIELKINSPNIDISNNRKILLDLKATKQVDEITYTYLDSRGRESKGRLCRGCKGYTRQISFNEGGNNLTFRAILNNKLVDEKTISFFVDSEKPRISETRPRRNSFTNGSEFYIKVREDNLKSIDLTFNPAISLDLNSCTESRGYHECSINLNLTSYNDQEINYYFSVEDIAGNKEKSKPTAIKVDTNPPILINQDSFWSRGEGRNLKYIYFDMSIDEKNFDEVVLTYDYRGKTQSKRLCSKLRSGKCEYRFKLNDAYSNYQLIVFDKAGNSIHQGIDFNP